VVVLTVPLRKDRVRQWGSGRHFLGRGNTGRVSPQLRSQRDLRSLTRTEPACEGNGCITYPTSSLCGSLWAFWARIKFQAPQHCLDTPATTPASAPICPGAAPLQRLCLSGLSVEMEVLSRAATTVPTKAGGCGAHSGHALPATASVDDVSISFDAAGDPRASPALVAPAVAVPKKLLRCKRQVEVLLRSERNHVPSSTYIQDIQHGHSGMTRDWRQSLVEWVIEVCYSACALSVLIVRKTLTVGGLAACVASVHVRSRVWL